MYRILFLFFLSCQQLCAQTRLPACIQKTTSLVFAHPIVHVERGTGDILVQRVQERMLLLKAGCVRFPTTNLLVLTAEGAVYSFTVYYAADTDTSVYTIAPQQQASLSSYAQTILQLPAFLHLHARHALLELSLSGIYVKGDQLFFQLRCRNLSPIDIPLSRIRLFLRDARQLKRTAQQERELPLVHVQGAAELLAAHSELQLVLVTPSPGMTTRQRLYIQLSGKEGGRTVPLILKSKTLEKARRLL